MKYVEQESLPPIKRLQDPDLRNGLKFARLKEGVESGREIILWSDITGNPTDNDDLTAILTSLQPSLGYTPLNRTLNLSDLSDLDRAIENLGLNANGVKDIWLKRAGDTATGLIIFTALQLSTSPATRYVLTSDADGVATWQPAQQPVVTVTADAALVAGVRCIPNAGSRLVLTLPATAAVGDTFIVTGKGSGGWQIAQNAGQTIHGATDSTTGAAGYIQSSARYDSVEVVCITANTDFVIHTSRGTITIA